MRTFRALGILASMLVLPAASSCGSAKKSAEGKAVQAKTGSPKPALGKVKVPVPGKSMDSDSDNAFGLQSIHFPPVSLQVIRSERDKLVKNAEILRAMPNIYVELEGHTDGRGKLNQSLELAEARAKVVKEVMIGLGIDASRMTTISYGKDKMLDRSGTLAGYRRNRRVNFLILRY